MTVDLISIDGISCDSLSHFLPQEEAYLREAIKASLEEEKTRKEKGQSPSKKPVLSAEATDLLIDFMDDFASTG